MNLPVGTPIDKTPIAPTPMFWAIRFNKTLRVSQIRYTEALSAAQALFGFHDAGMIAYPLGDHPDESQETGRQLKDQLSRRKIA
jgi:hypothetical protein